MDSFKIGALKVFADLGALIEQDEKNKIKFMDLPSDIVHNHIASHLLKDKKINKIFHNKEDNKLKYVLFGKNIDLPYINIYSFDNKIEVKNDELLKYVNYIIKQKGVNKVAKTINVSVTERHSQNKNCFSWLEKKIWFYDKEKNFIASIKENVCFSVVKTYYLQLCIKQQDKDIVQTIKKENIIEECYKIHEHISGLID